MRIATTPATALADTLLTDLVAGSLPHSGLSVSIERPLVPASVTDGDGAPVVDAVVLLGRECSAEFLSACDLAGIPIVGLVETGEDEAILNRLRLSERLRLPLTEEGLVAALGQRTIMAAPSLSPAPPASVPTTMGRMVTVWGAKGSPGVTSTALGLAATYADRGERVVLVDADVHGASIAMYLNVLDEAPGIAALCRHAGRGSLVADVLNDLVAHTGDERRCLDIVTGISDASRWPELGSPRLSYVLDLLRTSYDRVIVDVAFSLETDEEVSSDLHAPRRNGATVTCLRHADVVVAVTCPDPVALTRHILARPRLREILDDIPVVTCLNRVSAPRGRYLSASSATDTLRRFADVRDIVSVPEDVASMTRAVVAARPVVWAVPTATVSRAMLEVATLVDGILPRVRARQTTTPDVSAESAA